MAPKKDKSGEKSGIKAVKGENFYRDAKAAKRVKLLTKHSSATKATRDRHGNVLKAAEFQSSDAAPGRVQPDRRWFNNTRVIGQDALDHFRTALGAKASDPYSFVLRRNKLPMSLIQEPAQGKAPLLTTVEPFQQTFGPGAQRKRPRLEMGMSSFTDLAASSSERAEQEDEKQAAWEAKLAGVGLVSADREIPLESSEREHISLPEELYSAPVQRGRSEPVYSKGQSRRIWGELYKVIDSSDVILHVLDARDPMGTRCRNVEKHVREETPHKHLVYILNKVDLVPTWVTARWIKILSREFPTLAFHASINHSFGKGSLIQLLRQFSVLHTDKKQISVGFIGYPNTGKSSIINTLKKKKVCNVAPIPGETKVWQYISLMRRIYLIDCPGIVPVSAHDSETGTVLKGVVRVENLETPSEHIASLLSRVKPEYIKRTYHLDAWHDAEDFLSQLSQRMGKLRKGGEPDLDVSAKMVLNDWIRGKIPFFVPPPLLPARKEEEHGGKRVRGVEQPIRQIPVVPKFSAEDAQGGVPEDFVREDAPEPEAADAEEEDEGDDDDSNDDSDDNGKDVEDVEIDLDASDDDDFEGLTWDDVFNPAKEKAKETSTKRAVNDEPREKPSKEPRMTTSKRKAENYYTHANVKNKSRSKQAGLREASANREREHSSRIGANKKTGRTAAPKRRK
ncbi:GTPase required for pre-60S ribosomal subunit nuclear export and maturation [Malassezia vespertilionis]|uniref:Nucleolar GTP-binding protein 2 n=1 Tax=Malassezia vespertilionis TaxID=2020962 RepID=A0A2N1J8P9_9BASI|nr:GTPase required for pre-60S ribosomal subunit nuclear export and maturation [Malassezia vespertilionis]PKI82940.1 Nog2p [Malassezia vespertilionis]WFD08318.1 GTPase required for pre-60S ribosomal subunit nuclear export and maturation [Malassezia vespertilionis]